MSSTNVTELNAANWATEVTQSSLPVLVNFWSPGCAVCEKLSRAVDNIAKQFTGRVKVGKINFQENAGVAKQYEVKSVPRLLIFKGSKPLHEIGGPMMESDIARLLNFTLGG